MVEFRLSKPAVAGSSPVSRSRRATRREARDERGWWYTYLLHCRDGSIYTGITDDLKARIATHNEGRGAKYTRSRRPVKLLAAFAHRTKGAAMSREARIKRLTRGAKLALLRRLKPARRSPRIR